MRLLLSIIASLPWILCFGQQPVLILPTGHTDDILSYAVTKDERFLITGSRDNTAKIWNYKTGKLLHDLTVHTNNIVSVLVTSDDKTVVLASSDGSYSKWDIATGKLVFHSEVMASILKAFLYNGDSSILLIKENVVVVGYFGKKEEEVLYEKNYRLLGERNVKYTLSDDRSTLALLEPDGHLSFWDLKNGKPLSSTSRLIVDSNSYYSLNRIEPHINFIDNNRALINSSVAFGIVEIRTGKQIVYGDKKVAGYATNGNEFVYKLARTDSIHVMNLEQPARVHRFYHTGDQVPIRVFSDSIYVGNESGLSVLSLTGVPIRTVDLSIASTKESYYVYPNHYLKKNKNALEKWDQSSGNLILSFSGKIPQLNSVSYIPNSRYLLEFKDSFANYWDLTHMKPYRLPLFRQEVARSVYPTHISDQVLLQYKNGLVVYSLAASQILHSAVLKGGWDVKMLKGDSAFITTSGKDVVRWSVTNLLPVRQWEMKRFIGEWVLSPDERYFAYQYSNGYADSIYIWDLDENTKVSVIPRKGHYIEPGYATVYTPKYTPVLKFSTDSKYLFYSEGETGWISIARNPLREIRDEDQESFGAEVIYQEGTLQFFNGHHNIAEIPEEQSLLLTQDNENGEGSIVALEYEGSIKYTLNYPDFQRIIYYDNKQQILHTATKKEWIVWDVAAKKIIHKQPIPEGFTAETFIPERNAIILYSTSGFGILHKGKPAYLFHTLSNNEKVVYRTDGYYTADPAGSRYFSWKIRDRFYDFDQWDLQYNRPDLILELAGDAGKDLTKAYYIAYNKRIERQKNSKPYVEGESPEVTILNQETDGEKVKSRDFQLALKIETYKKAKPRSVIISVNGNPVHGSNGLPVSAKDITTPILLSRGWNQIRVSAIDDKGRESLKEQRTIFFESGAKEPTATYFIGIGLDRYQDSSQDLNWCVKDIRDLSRDLSRGSTGRFLVDTLFNEHATKAKITALKDRLSSLNVDDKVIIVYSGHGLFSKDFEFFLSTYDADFSKPEEEALSYEALEALLADVPARQKLILLDACHSGEVDKEDIERFTWNATSANDSVRSERKPELQSNSLGVKSSFELMQELFLSVSSQTGATVIAAAGATQFAQERAGLENGVFTYAVREYLRMTTEPTVSGLRSYVAKRVTELTNGQQMPTTRADVLYDWSLR